MYSRKLHYSKYYRLLTRRGIISQKITESNLHISVALWNNSQKIFIAVIMGNCATKKAIEASTDINANDGERGRQQLQSLDDAATHISADTHLVYQNESIDYEDTRVVFYEVSLFLFLFH